VAGPLVLGAEGSFTSSITGKTTALRVYTPQGYTDQVRRLQALPNLKAALLVLALYYVNSLYV
jgi:hypothetical protein